MIISKKRFKEEIEKAVKLALEKKEQEIRLSNMETHLNDKIDDLASHVFSDISDLRDRIDDLENAMWRKITELSCKISHKKKPLNE